MSTRRLVSIATAIACFFPPMALGQDDPWASNVKGAVQGLIGRYVDVCQPSRAEAEKLGSLVARGADAAFGHGQLLGEQMFDDEMGLQGKVAACASLKNFFVTRVGAKLSRERLENGPPDRAR